MAYRASDKKYAKTQSAPGEWPKNTTLYKPKVGNKKSTVGYGGLAKGNHKPSKHPAHIVSHGLLSPCGRNIQLSLIYRHSTSITSLAEFRTQSLVTAFGAEIRSRDSEPNISEPEPRFETEIWSRFEAKCYGPGPGPPTRDLRSPGLRHTDNQAGKAETSRLQRNFLKIT